jgi:hypothetical protein
MDWVAFGLPVDKGQKGPSMVIEKLERRVPTCKLNESVGEARRRAEKLGFQICVVVNERGNVLGVIEKDAWKKGSSMGVETAINPGPTTLRPSYLLEDAKKVVTKSGRGRHHNVFGWDVDRYPQAQGCRTQKTNLKVRIWS